MAVALSCAFADGTAEDEVRLEGVVMDPSDNLISGVRVALRTAGVETVTGPNGDFILSFPRPDPWEPGRRGIYDNLEFDREGYIGSTIDIRDLSFFDEKVTGILEPNPVGEDNVGFSIRMNLDPTLPPVMRSEPDFALRSFEDWEKFFEALHSKETTGQTGRGTFYAHIPKDVDQLNAVFLISLHGMGTIDHPSLRDFAERNGVALVGVIGEPVQRGLSPVDLLDAPLQRLGEMAGRPELVDLPILAFGHSNGTGFSGIVAAERPDRTIAWISYHSGSNFHLQFPGSEKVPSLVMHGHLDKFFENGQEPTIRNLRRERNAPTGLFVGAYTGHFPVEKDHTATWDFIVAYCEAAMRTRLNEDGTLRPVKIEEGWLGAPYDRELGGLQDLAIAPYAEYEGDRSIANWLPDEEFAKLWREFGLTDPRPEDQREK